jgi:hypothetical protein
LHALYCTAKIRKIKQDMLAEHVAHVEFMSYSYKISVRKSEGERLHGKLGMFQKLVLTLNV